MSPNASNQEIPPCARKCRTKCQLEDLQLRERCLIAQNVHAESIFDRIEVGWAESRCETEDFRHGFDFFKIQAEAIDQRYCTIIAGLKDVIKGLEADLKAAKGCINEGRGDKV